MLKLAGTLTSGAFGACCGGGPLQTMFAVDFSQEVGDAKRVAGTATSEDPSVYATIAGIGAGTGVPKASFLFVRSSGRVMLRMTLDPVVSTDPNLVIEVPVEGLGIWQWPSVNRLKLLEMKGSGTLEYVASGT